jgi:hypothetical protein
VEFVSKHHSIMTSLSFSPEVTDAIQQLALAVEIRVAELRRSGKLVPRLHPHARVRFAEFSYGESGIRYSGYNLLAEIKEVWWGGPIEAAAGTMRSEVEATALRASG